MRAVFPSLSSTTNKFSDMLLNLSAFSVLRSISGIAALFLYPAKAYQYLFVALPKIHVPLFDFALFYSPTFIFLIKAVYLTSLVTFILGYKVEFTGVTAGIAKFILYIALPDRILPFAYLLPFGWIAFSVIEFGRKNKIEQQRLESPLVWFMCSVYLSAALHKIFHFNLMKHFLPFDLGLFARPDIKPYILSQCPNMDCLLVDFLLYSSIPVELVLFLLFAFRKTRIWALALAIIFHLFLGIFLSLIPIAFFCLLFESSILLLRYDVRLRDIFKYNKNKIFFPGLTVLILLLMVLSSFNSLEIKVFYYILFSLLSCSPFIYLAIFLRELQCEKYFLENLSLAQVPLLTDKASDRMKQKWLIGNGILIFVFALFGASPAIVDNYRKTFIWGWTVFSGAETKWKPKRVQLKLPRCQTFPNYFPFLLTIPRGSTEYEFVATSEEFLDRYIVQLKKECQ